eukprot:5490658-Amphidinium_carterae.1
MGTSASFREKATRSATACPRAQSIAQRLLLITWIKKQATQIESMTHLERDQDFLMQSYRRFQLVSGHFRFA